MRRPSKLTDWFNANDQAQLEWARNYWTDKANEAMAAQMTSSMALPALLPLEQYAEGRELLARMRRAWNSRVSKAKGKRRTFSFVLPVATEQRLRELAKGSPKSATLEALINRGFDFEQALAKERRDQMREEVARLRKSHPLAPSGPLEAERANQRARELKDEMQELSEVLDAALHENCVLRVKLKDAGIDPERILNADQQIRAQQDFETRRAWLDRDLRSRKRLGKKGATSSSTEAPSVRD